MFRRLHAQFRLIHAPSWSLTFVLLLLFAISVFSLSATAAEETTLTIRTTDGLILLSDSDEKLSTLRDALGKTGVKLDTVGALAAIRAAGDTPWGIGVYYSSRSGVRWKKPDTEKMTLADAVRRGLIPNIAGRALDDAYVLLRANGMEMRLLGSPPAGSALAGRAVVSLHSSMIGGKISSIAVNGEVFTAKNPGYLLVVLDPAGGKVIDSAEFAMYADFGPAAEMERFLNRQPDGAILLGVDFLGQGVFFSGGALEALRRYGVRAPMDPQISFSHAVVGRKGLPQGAGLEAYARAQDSKITVFPEYFYVAEEKLLEPGGAGAGIATVFISDTAPASEVIITRW